MKLTEEENNERLHLLDLQKDHNRPMPQEEFDRLKYLQAKLYISGDKKNRTYTIEVSHDRNWPKTWRPQAQFVHGQKSCFDDAPFDEVIAVREAEGFRLARRFAHVRLIISI